MVALKAEKGFMMTFHFATSHDLVVGGMLEKSQTKLFFDLRYSKECVCVYICMNSKIPLIMHNMHYQLKILLFGVTSERF